MENIINLKELKKEIPFKWRVQSFSKFKPEANCVAYIDSRQVQDLLDKVVGPENWQDKYEEHKGNLFCSIGINCEHGWVWKTDCGIESNVDKQKGEASDAFKRAAVKWGIGRFLYSKKIVRLLADKKKEQGQWPSVIDSRGKKVWDLTSHINGSLPVKENPLEKQLKELRKDFIDLKKEGRTTADDEAFLKEAGGDIAKLKATINSIREREYPEGLPTPPEFDGNCQ